MSESALALSEVNGRRFWHLTAVSYRGTAFGKSRGTRKWAFRCDCGKEVVHSLWRVKRGVVRSCGCVELAQYRQDVADKQISPFVAQHGRYERAVVVARLGLVETEFSEATVNRNHSVIDGWIDEEIFERRHIRVIEHARDLWREISRPTHDFFDSWDPEDEREGLEAERAKNLLRRARSLVHERDWRIFENVIRWNEPLGLPGSRLLAPNEKAKEAVQEIVIDVAETIALALFL